MNAPHVKQMQQGVYIIITTEMWYKNIILFLYFLMFHVSFLSLKFSDFFRFFKIRANFVFISYCKVLSLEEISKNRILASLLYLNRQLT
jgi:hypothetical protein